jgi:lipopolysaccharide exporter
MAAMAAVRHMTESEEIGGRVRRGVAWSLLNNLTLRVGTFAVSIALARILAPEDFGIFAIALTVQTILINLAELGLAADLVRHGNLESRGPTIATLSLASSTVLTLIMVTTAPVVATAMGSADATPVIQLMAVTMVLAGIGVVPFAQMQREFMQKQLFAIDAVSLLISTGLTVTLALAGFGAMSLAIARVTAQLTVTLLQFAFTRRRLRFGWNADIARSGFRFGFPLSCAGLLALVLLNVDYVLVGRLMGPISLGIYFLAFNISSWPTTIVGTAIRSVAMPAFAQRGRVNGHVDHADLLRATALTWAVALPIGTALAVLSTQTIHVVYGARWLPAATALVGLGLFGTLRVVFDLWVAYLTARGSAGALLWTQSAWIVTLAPVMIFAIRTDGLTGAGWSHAIVAAFFMLPLYLVAMRRVGVAPTALLRCLVPGLLAILPAALASWLVSDLIAQPLVSLFIGGVTLLAVYAALLGPWFRKQGFIAPNREPRARRVVARRRILKEPT